ncbi:glycosyltransferase family protein [Micrococcus luteus]|uniref:glycosyltransferase family protein n=1 Tax=Micrococcus luteus TaxID=1270 RepID=UPI000E1B93AF|nr:glycosyltransferase [Micrococcus luteus]
MDMELPTPGVVPAELETRRRKQPHVATHRRNGRASGLRVACILDEFSTGSFGPEAELVPLTMRHWSVELAAGQPDLLLVESAWRGHRETWWNAVHRNGPELQGILQWCRARGVPTAFWNKEDPVHFDTFLAAAAEFDVVFTTDLDCVPRYKEALGHERVHFLPFAAQPSQFNPVELFDRVDGCAFAGAYYERYPERIADLEELSNALQSEGRRFDIYDRNLGKEAVGYTFPAQYRDLIVGGSLPPSLVNVAYKGYTLNLNLNSVKQSQSMFARRVFDVIASNTLVVSNFSRGLRTLFGNLVLTTDSGTELHRRLGLTEENPNGIERLRGMALRKIMREHTYAHRLEYVAKSAGVTLPPAKPERPFLISWARSEEASAALLRRFSRQSAGDWHLVIIDSEATQAQVNDPRIHIRPTMTDAFKLAERLGCTHLGFLDEEDWHGPHYLEDMLHAFRWADVKAVGHAEAYAVDSEGKVIREGAGTAWSPNSALDLRRSLMLIEDWSQCADDFGSGMESLPLISGLAVSCLEFISGGSALSSVEREPASVLDVDEGLSLAVVQEFAGDLNPEAATKDPDAQVLTLAEVLGGLPAHEDFSAVLNDDGSVAIGSRLDPSAHQYWVNPHLFEVPVDWAGSVQPIYVDAGVGLDVILVAYYFDAQKQRIGHSMIALRTAAEIAVPEDATHLRWGLRLKGPGTRRISQIVNGTFIPAAQPVLTRADTVVVTNIYPSYDDLYRNGFIHSRVRAYAEEGLRSEVLRVHPSAETAFAEFEGIDTAWISDGVLSKTLDHHPPRNVLVHFLDGPMWRVLRGHNAIERIVVWVHGAEVQPWWRRTYNYASEAELEAAKPESDRRLELWREIFTNLPENFHFVFVSQYFADEVFEDVGVTLPSGRYSIIHNPIDEELFTYVPKPPAQRNRILSVRPYASAKYANDLSVSAVLELKDRAGFDNLQFTFIGDGILFEETLEPLRGIPNVEIRRGFLTHPELASEHKHHGVFLTPTRMDAQGVSRDEAMSSGLVPITSNVAAIPEFVDENCGILAPAEDYVGLAEGIWQLAHSPETFLEMSQAAADRVRRQSAARVVVPQEISLLRTRRA